MIKQFTSSNLLFQIELYGAEGADIFYEAVDAAKAALDELRPDEVARLHAGSVWISDAQGDHPVDHDIAVELMGLIPNLEDLAVIFAGRV